MADSPFSTPKRKRSEMLNDGVLTLNTTTQFTFDVNSAHEDGNASPRTRVAHRFRGLALGGGGGAGPSSSDMNTMDNEVDEGSRKRVKFPDVEMRDADSPAAGIPEATSQSQPPQCGKNEGLTSGRRLSLKAADIALDDAVVEQIETVANTNADDRDSNSNTTTPSLTPPTPPPVTSGPAQPRNHPLNQRAATPPFLTAPTSTTTAKPTSPNESTITDPLRASLTWHDDEITIYDPDDSDDDGTGINGIGFKPTPAIAYARTVRRRQLLAEYRKREEREARAKRSLRRRGASPAPGMLEKTKGKGDRERRRVRFMETAVSAEMIGV
jgi:hypothetical protein